jgi:hypothetical protein
VGRWEVEGCVLAPSYIRKLLTNKAAIGIFVPHQG